LASIIILLNLGSPIIGMKTIDNLRERRAISPVIATVILVAVAITIAVAVSYWMSGIAGQYTSFEKVSIKSAYASPKYSASPSMFQGWVITMGLQNTGSSPATLESLFVNEKPILEYGVYGTSTIDKIRWIIGTPPEPTDPWSTWEILETDVTSINLDSGDETTIYILVYGLKPDGLFSAGTTINVKLHSANGYDYIKLVQLT